MLFRLILLSLLGISVSGLLSCASTDSSKRQPASEEIGSLDEDEFHALLGLFADHGFSPVSRAIG
jgi:hypothetical protein